MTQGSNNLHFFYDASNKPAIVEYNGTKYAYVHNLQGDIVAILDSNGTKVVEYKYDAWGRPISKAGSMKDSLGTLNPFRYRGYVYDEETGLNYVESRYYASLWSRFVNADNVIILDSISMSRFINLYTYCNNAPVTNKDVGGHWSLGCLFSGVLNVVIGAAAVITAYSALAAIPVASLAFTVAYVSVAVVTGVAGAASTITGASDAIEGITDYNPIRDNLPNEDWQNGYDFVSGLSPVVATMGAYSLAPFMVHPPKEARDTASYVKRNNSAPPGHSSGPHKGHELKQLGVTAQSYTEYDIYANKLPKDRGLERIVADSNNRIYYTNDHYSTFWRMMFIK